MIKYNWMNWWLDTTNPTHMYGHCNVCDHIEMICGDQSKIWNRSPQKSTQSEIWTLSIVLKVSNAKFVYVKWKMRLGSSSDQLDTVVSPDWTEPIYWQLKKMNSAPASRFDHKFDLASDKWPFSCKRPAMILRGLCRRWLTYYQSEVLTNMQHYCINQSGNTIHSHSPLVCKRRFRDRSPQRHRRPRIHAFVHRL